MSRNQQKADILIVQMDTKHATWDVKAVKFLTLPLPAPLEVLYFRVRFRFFTFGIFCFRFQLQIELVASEFASASSLFHQSASAKI